MKYKLFVILTLLVFSISLYAQRATLSGFIKDSETGGALLYATCVNEMSKTGVTSNDYGYFSIILPLGKVNIHASYVGYETQRIEFIITGDTSIVISLNPKINEIKEVVINAHSTAKEDVLMGKTNVPVKTIKAIPSFLGEPDVLKAISFMPGIATGKDGYSNIYVRGGDRGQNLILLDGMKLYNTNHVGGFISLFNSDVIKHVDVYKGGFPARFGGRTSSIIDIHTKDGSSGKFGGKFNIGLLSTSAIIEGTPVNNINYLLAVRTSYFDLFTIPNRISLKDGGDGTYWNYTFFDVNGKLSWQTTEKHRLSLSFFTGQDHQKSYDKFQNNNYDLYNDSYENIEIMKIYNTGVSISATSVISPKLFMKNMLGYSYYQNRNATHYSTSKYASEETTNKTTSTKINDLTYHGRLEWIVNNQHNIKTGLEATNYRFVPELQSMFYETLNAGNSIDTVTGVKNDIKSYEVSIYAEDEISISNNVKINAGFRTTSYFCNDAAYYRIEPRISLRWLFLNEWAAKMNYTIMNQFNHVVINNEYGWEKEIWVAATDNIPPQTAEQTSLGLFYGNDEQKTDISVEFFYKKMRHLIDYKTPIHNANDWGNIENRMTKNGKGESYGVEIQLKKEMKKMNINMSYTLSRSNRQFDELNNGAWFPFIYDRTHNLNILALWKISDKYSFSGNFALSTGMPYSLPVAYSTSRPPYFYQYYIYGSINNRRLPLYHRLDVSFVRKFKTERRGNNCQFYINIFNVYARQNAVSVFYDINTGKAYQKAIFTIVPTIGYSIEF